MQLDYGLEQRVPFLKNLLFGLQWAALLISSTIIFGKVIGAFYPGGSLAHIIYLQKLLFISAITLFCQIYWGHKLPIIPGPSAILLIGVIASQGFGTKTIYSSVMIGGVFIAILAVSGLFKAFQKLFTTNVVAVVLLLIAFTLAPTIQGLIIGSQNGIDPLYHLGFSFILIFLLFLFYRLLKGIWKSTLIIWAMVAGSFIYFLIFPSGPAVDGLSNAHWFSGFFRNMNLQVTIQPGVLLSFLICFIALSINDLGSIQSVNTLLNAENMDRRLTRGIFVTGLGNMVSGFFGVIGPVNYAISPGVLASTRCGSRFTLLPTVIITLIFAFSPAATGFIGKVPPVVIGAILAYVMTSQVSAGLILAFKNVKEEDVLFKNGLVIGLSILLGVVVAFLPDEVSQTFPTYLRPLLGNGFVMGTLSALILEHIFLRNSTHAKKNTQRK